MSSQSEVLQISILLSSQSIRLAVKSPGTYKAGIFKAERQQNSIIYNLIYLKVTFTNYGAPIKVHFHLHTFMV